MYEVNLKIKTIYVYVYIYVGMCMYVCMSAEARRGYQTLCN